MSVTGITPPELRAARERLYIRQPEDVAKLEGRRQIMQPAGPLLYAEAESRLLHEQLSMLTLALDAAELDLERAVPMLQFILRRAANRLAGWYLLDEAGALAERTAAALDGAEHETRLALLRELALYVGRLNYWLDLTIPWNDVNELLRRQAEGDAQ